MCRHVDKNFEMIFQRRKKIIVNRLGAAMRFQCFDHFQKIELDFLNLFPPMYLLYIFFFRQFLFKYKFILSK